MRLRSSERASSRGFQAEGGVECNYCTALLSFVSFVLCRPVPFFQPTEEMSLFSKGPTASVVRERRRSRANSISLNLPAGLAHLDRRSSIDARALLSRAQVKALRGDSRLQSEQSSDEKKADDAGGGLGKSNAGDGRVFRRRRRGGVSINPADLAFAGGLSPGLGAGSGDNHDGGLGPYAELLQIDHSKAFLKKHVQSTARDLQELDRLVFEKNKLNVSAEKRFLNRFDNRRLRLVEAFLENELRSCPSVSQRRCVQWEGRGGGGGGGGGGGQTEQTHETRRRRATRPSLCSSHRARLAPTHTSAPTSTPFSCRYSVERLRIYSAAFRALIGIIPSCEQVLKSVKDAFDKEVLRNVSKDEVESARAALEGGRVMPWEGGRGVARESASGTRSGGMLTLPAPPPPSARGAHGTASGRRRPEPSPNARRRPKVSEGKQREKLSSSTPSLFEGSMYDIKRAGMDQLPSAELAASLAARVLLQQVSQGGAPLSSLEHKAQDGRDGGDGDGREVAANDALLSKSKRFVLAKEVRKLMRSRGSGGRAVRVRHNAPFAPTWEKRASQWLTKYFYGNLRRVWELYGKRQNGQTTVPTAVRIRMLLPIYSACFNELIRRTGTECTQRASIAMRVWKGVLEILHRGTMEMRRQRRE